MPPLPLNRLLRIKQPDLFANADSGDLLLEGSFYKARSLYVQDIGGSLSSSVGVLYRDPVTGCLFVLTSRVWSKRYHQEKHASKDTLDLASRDYAQLSCIDGVTMHPLDAWVSQARARGSYFLLRKLTKGKRPPTSLQRQRVGQRLLAWFLAHGGVQAPTASEQRLRLKGSAKIDARLAEMLGTDTGDAQDASLPARSLGHVTRLCGFAERDKYAALLQRAETGKGSMSCSQVVLGALEHADIFDLGAAVDPEAAQARRVWSSSNMFEMRRLPFRAPRGTSGFGGWGYEMLTLVTGDKEAVSTRGRVTSMSHLGRVEMSVYGQPLNLEEGAV